jgi:hypothetical protein
VHDAETFLQVAIGHRRGRIGEFLRAALFAGVLAAPVLAGDAHAQAEFHGYVQGNYTFRTADPDCPPGYDCAVMRADDRMQLTLDLASADGRTGAFARVDLFYDGLGDSSGVDAREILADINLGFLSARLGRQVITWGLGDLLFINDVFPKDWVAFLTGAPLEYLKLGSDALLVGAYSSSLNAEVVVIPVFQPDEVPSGSPLFFYDPAPTLTDWTVEKPPVEYQNIQTAGRAYRSFGRYEAALYASHGFYGTPAARPDDPSAPTSLIFFYPRLLTCGFTFQGPLASGVLSFEGGYYDSLDDPSGTDPYIVNSQVRGLAAYQMQPWAEASLSFQYYVEAMQDYAAYLDALPPGLAESDELRQVVTVRLRQFLLHQTMTTGFFALGSPSDEDLYVNPFVRYQLTDELWTEVGGNFFSGKEAATAYGQFEDNSNVYLTARYGF